MAARWQAAPVVGGAYTDDTRPWSVQDALNWIPVRAEREGGRSASLLRCAPGASVFCVPGPAAPVRGLRDVEGKLFAVIGSSLYQITVAGVAIPRGAIPGVARVSMAHNQITGGNELVIANGISGYVYNTKTETLVQITDDGFPGFKSLDYVDSYIVGVEPYGRYWFHSDLADATSYNTLDRYEAESAPDRIVGLVVSHREVFVLGERTGEFFRNTGEATGTFQRISGSEMEVGCAAQATICQMDNTVFWLGNDGCVYRLNGYQPVRISTFPIEQAISRSSLAEAFAFTYEDRGHKVYYLTFPDGLTWGFDVASNEWARRGSKGFNRWRMNCLTRWNKQWIAGDFINGKLYRLEWDQPWEHGEVIERRRVTGVLHDNQNIVTLDALELVMNVGVGDKGPGELNPPQPAGPSISGDAPNWVQYGEYPGFAYTLTAGGSPVVSVKLVSGALPDGFAISTSGVITGATDVAGDYEFTVRVVDQNGLWADVEDAINIAEADVFIADVDIDALNATIDGSYAGLILDGDVDGFTADDVFVIDKPEGLIYQAFSIWSTDDNPLANGKPWFNRFDVTDDSDVTTTYWPWAESAFPTAAESDAWARDKQVILTGSTYYKIWIYDTPVNDNRGGLSLRVRKGTPA